MFEQIPADHKNQKKVGIRFFFPLLTKIILKKLYSCQWLLLRKVKLF